MEVKFTSTQREYGDIQLVDRLIEKLGLKFPISANRWKPGIGVIAEGIQLMRAEKAIGHSDFNQYFRPDICWYHLRSLIFPLTGEPAREYNGKVLKVGTVKCLRSETQWNVSSLLTTYYLALPSIIDD